MVESLLDDSSEIDKIHYLEFVQFVNTMIDPDTGKPVVNPKTLIEAGRGIMDKSVDIDKLLESKPTNRTPDDILKSAGLDDTMGSQTNAPEQSP